MISIAANRQEIKGMLSTPQTINKWTQCKVSEFIRNSEVFAFNNSFLYFISDFSEFYNFQERVLRMLDTRSGKWFIPIYAHARVITFIENTLLFQHMRNDDRSHELYGCDVYNKENREFLHEVPEWATHYKMHHSAKGETIYCYWSRKRAEVRNAQGICFEFNNYQCTKKDIDGYRYIHESNIIGGFGICDNIIVLNIVNKTNPESNWNEFGVHQSNVEVTRQKDGLEKRSIHAGNNNWNDKEIWETLTFNFDGIQVEGSFKNASTCTYDSLEDKQIEKLKKSFKKISHSYKHINRHEEKEWSVFWDEWGLELYHSISHKECFSLGVSALGKNRIDRVFFDKDLIVVLLYEQELKQVESGNQYCSGSSCYDVDKEYRNNYRLNYYDVEGKLLRTIKLEGYKEFLDHKRAPKKLTKFISATDVTLGTITKKNSLKFVDLETKRKLVYPNFKTYKVVNNRYLVTAGDRCFSVATGLEKVCAISQPWISVRLFGPHLAIASEQGIHIVNLDNDTIELSEKCTDAPKKIMGFVYKNSPDDFLAVQFDSYANIWHRTV